MGTPQIIFIACVVAYTLAAALIDWRTRKLPNNMTVPALAGALVFHTAWGFSENGLAGVGEHLLFALGGFALGFGILFVLWVIGSGGGGDVKFMAALGAWVGPQQIVWVYLVGAVVIVIGSVCVLAYSSIQRGAMRTKEKYLDGDRSTKEGRVKRRILSYGVAAAPATWIVLALAGVPALNEPETTPTDGGPQATQPAGVETSFALVISGRASVAAVPRGARRPLQKNAANSLR